MKMHKFNYSNGWIPLARSVLANDQDYTDGGRLTRRVDGRFILPSRLLGVQTQGLSFQNITSANFSLLKYY